VNPDSITETDVTSYTAMFNPLFLRTISQLVLLTFTSLTLQPLQAAVMAEKQQHAIAASQAPAPMSRDERYGKGLQDMREVLERAEKKQKRGERDDDEIQQLRTQKTELDAMESQVEADFKATEQHLKDANLPAEILARHQAAVKEFQLKQSELKQKLQAVAEADDAKDQALRSQKVRELADFMQVNQHHKTHPPTDPNKLPFSTPSGKVRAPKETERDFKTSLFRPVPIHLAGPIPNGFTLPATNLPLTPTAEDLAPTEDIVLTPAIQALATSLNNNPVQIYNWVRNNIEFLPTYGSIQGADMTLQTKRGNSFDTASLLIGLFRAAGIPARYVYGTIQVPADQAMNWVGGVTKPEAAQQLMGQGGIPNIGLAAGGLIKAIELEHVWVEAYVDYTPSRGAINKKPNTWIPMDASYKQYTYAQGMDIKGQVPFDAQALATQAQVGATVDPSGWVQNINSTAIQSALTSYQTQVQNYINTTKPNATVGDVIGAKTIIPQNYSILLGTLPYKTVATGGKFTVIPSNLRHTISLNLYSDPISQALGSADVSYTISLPALNSRRLGVTYQPASAADAQLIQSYQTSGATSLPVYLVHVMPLIQLDGVTVASGSAITMGQPQTWDATLADPQNLITSTETFNTTAGDEMVFGVNGNGITPEIVKQRFASTPSNTAAENLQQIALTYWMECDLFDGFAAQTYNVNKLRMPSLGLFASPLTVSYFFGIPRSGTYKGRYMDVKRDLLAVVADTQQARFAFMSQSGIQGSYLEGAVFDQLLQRQKGSAVSAIQILLDASKQGVPIHLLSKSNIDTDLPKLSISPSVKLDILNFVNAGKSVLVPEREILHQGWFGVGYIAKDTVTGAGAYMIDGGLNGASSGSCKNETLPLVVALQAIVITAFIIEMALITIALSPVVIGAAVAGTEAVAGFSAIVQTLMVSMGVSFLAFPASASESNPYACECLLQQEADEAFCISVKARYGSSGQAICLGTAQTRYGECLRAGVSGIKTPLFGGP
jgi:transglutaminase-like putative cysteine protease/multisubunit Na+/H+ antiporter MnhC subunit